MSELPSEPIREPTPMPIHLAPGRARTPDELGRTQVVIHIDDLVRLVGLDDGRALRAWTVDGGEWVHVIVEGPADGVRPYKLTARGGYVETHVWRPTQPDEDRDARAAFVEDIRVASFEAPKAQSHGEWATRLNEALDRYLRRVTHVKDPRDGVG